MKLLLRHEEDPTGMEILARMPGTYYLYRRHSVLPGVLKEIVVVTDRHYGHCEGVYLQFNRIGSCNVIDFNVFFAGFYLLAFGAHNDAMRKRTEILEVKVLIENILTENKQIDCSATHLIGLLTGVFDYGNMLLAERILLERFSDECSVTPQMKPERLLPDGPTADEFRRVRDVIDNSLDGQVFAARLSRLEEML
jgi:hypothetical protein